MFAIYSDAIKEQLSTCKFDRIILLHCLHQLHSSSTLSNNSDSHQTRTSQSSDSIRLVSFIQFIRQSLSNNGQLLIVHREPNINTLPLPIEIINKWYDADEHSARLIEQLHRERTNNFELIWEVETVKFVLAKLIWYNLIFHQKFYPLTLSSQQQVNNQ
jgi:hypothetical protein